MMFDPKFQDGRWRMVRNALSTHLLRLSRESYFLLSSTHDLESTVRALLKRGHDWSDKNVLFHWVWWGKCHT